MSSITYIIIHYEPGEIKAILFRLSKARNLSKMLQCHHLVTFSDISWQTTNTRANVKKNKKQPTTYFQKLSSWSTDLALPANDWTLILFDAFPRGWFQNIFLICGHYKLFSRFTVLKCNANVKIHRRAQSPLPVSENCGIRDVKLSRAKSGVSSRRVFVNVPVSPYNQIKEKLSGNCTINISSADEERALLFCVFIL